MKNKTMNLSTPSLILDVNKLEKNIIKMSKYCIKNNIKIRPHAKSHKMSNLAKIQIKNGAVGICVATLHEAEIMVKNNIPGILLTSPISNNHDVGRLKNLIKQSKGFSLVIDNEFSINYLNNVCKPKNLKLSVLIDCDIMRIGKNKISRTGARSIKEIVKLAKLINNNKYLNYKGITAYAGDVQHISNYHKRYKEILLRNKYLKDIINSLNKANLPPLIVSGGGTGSHDIDAKSSIYTEIQPGSYVFNDVEYSNVSIYNAKISKFDHSLFVASSIISKVNQYKYIVNAGLKAFSTDSKYLPLPFGKIPKNTQYKFMGDEHGMINLPKNSKQKLSISDTIFLYPPHCDPTINLYEKCNILKKDKIVASWNIDARGYGLN